jgi:predicted kinase
MLQSSIRIRLLEFFFFMKQKIVLFGGYCGSGKSTLTDGLIEHVGHGTNLDFDLINKREGGFDPSDLEKSKSIIERINENDFPHAIEQAIIAGDQLIIAAATFLQRELRDRVMDTLEPYKETVDIYPLLMMLPMKETISRIKRGRIGDSHLINDQTVTEFYREANKNFKQDNHEDLLLPSNREDLPSEFRSMLRRREENKELLESPHLDLSGKRTWVVTTRELTVADLQVTLREAPNPLLLRL